MKCYVHAFQAGGSGLIVGTVRGPPALPGVIHSTEPGVMSIIRCGPETKASKSPSVIVEQVMSEFDKR